MVGNYFSYKSYNANFHQFHSLFEQILMLFCKIRIFYFSIKKKLKFLHKSNLKNKRYIAIYYSSKEKIQEDSLHHC